MFSFESTENMPKELTVEIGSFIQLQDQGGHETTFRDLGVNATHRLDRRFPESCISFHQQQQSLVEGNEVLSSWVRW